MKQEKACPRCKAMKSNFDYYPSRGSSDGLTSYCKACSLEIKRDGRKLKKGYYAVEGKQLKIKAIDHYSSGTMKCDECGYNDLRALCIEQIEGFAKYRNKLKDVYRWVAKNNYPGGFQVLCMNCVCVKRLEQCENINSKCRVIANPTVIHHGIVK